MPCRRFPLLSRHIVLAGLGVLAGCAVPPAPPAAPVPAPPASPLPAPAAVSDWRDAPLTAGTWRYVPGESVSSARYGRDDVPADLIVRCDRSTRRVALLRSGVATEMSIVTSAGTDRRPAGRIDDGGTPMTGVLFTAADPLLDRMIFSRGRFAIAAPGTPTLSVPAWAEPARAVEDCRK